MDEVQAEIFRLTTWTRNKRIKFEPTKTAVLACHRDKKIRDQLKDRQLYLDQEGKEKLQWVPHAKFLGITFSENCTFHEHWRIMMAKCKSRINVLWRFKGKIPGKTLYRVYKAAIEPLLTYGSEVLFETLSDVVTKRLLSIEFQAVRLAYNLGMRAPIAECLPFITNSIVSVIDKRREKFIARNLGNPLIRHTESLRFSEGRKLRVWKNYTDKSAPGGYMKQFYLHKEVFFFSGASYGNIPQLECCTEGLSKEVDKTPEGERRFDGQIIPRIRIRPAHKNDGLEDAEFPPSTIIPSTREVIYVDDEEGDAGLLHDHGYSTALLRRSHLMSSSSESESDPGTFFDHNYAATPRMLRLRTITQQRDGQGGMLSQYQVSNSQRGSNSCTLDFDHTTPPNRVRGRNSSTSSRNDEDFDRGLSQSPVNRPRGDSGVGTLVQIDCPQGDSRLQDGAAG